jgi:hypothetical protein
MVYNYVKLSIYMCIPTSTPHYTLAQKLTSPILTGAYASSAEACLSGPNLGKKEREYNDSVNGHSSNLLRVR